MPKMSIAGYELSLQKGQAPEKKAKIKKGIEILKKYKAGKENLEAKIIDNEQWYKLQHWNIIRGRKAKDNEPEPVTAYLFSTLANKHADAMDNFPEPNMLPRQQDDEQEARTLSDIVPIVLERNNFRRTYDDAWWYKLKHGTACYGCFWNYDLENGLGDIDIQHIDLLNVYWQPGVTNIQKSPYFFVTTLVDDEVLLEQYKDIIPDNFSDSKIIDVKQYVFDDSIDITGKSVVVDMYYKKRVGDKTVLHLTKFVDEYDLGSTEDDEALQDTGIEMPEGLYQHGEYPFEFDVLFPEAGMPTGFGYIDIVRNPQMYIDKLDQIISKNALLAGKQRFLTKENDVINEKELLDYSIDVIHSKGGITEDDLRILQANPLHPFVIQHRQEKINELKETSGTNDVSRGQTGGGVTAASAIMALQEAGSKTSRDMIQRSYGSFTRVVYMAIELIRQFYDNERTFRVERQNGTPDYIPYNNQRLQEQQLPTTYMGEEPKYRKPVFDIKVKPERQSPFSRIAHNEYAKELFIAGFFNPQVAPASLIALDMMQFEGKEKVIQKVSENNMLFQQMQQMQQQIQMYQQQMMKMGGALQQLTGEDLGIQVQKEGAM